MDWLARKEDSALGCVCRSPIIDGEVPATRCRSPRPSCAWNFLTTSRAIGSRPAVVHAASRRQPGSAVVDDASEGQMSCLVVEHQALVQHRGRDREPVGLVRRPCCDSRIDSVASSLPSQVMILPVAMGTFGLL